MQNIEHPMITRTLRTGYPIAVDERPVGIDYFGDEIFEGDHIVVDPHTNEVILEDNLEDYLIEVLGFIFKEAV